jgi:hypothetical protein
VVEESRVWGSERHDPVVVTGVEMEIVELELEVVLILLPRSPSSHL